VRLGQRPEGVIDFCITTEIKLTLMESTPSPGQESCPVGHPPVAILWGGVCPTRNHRLRRSHLRKHDKGQAGAYSSTCVNLCQEQSTYPMAHFMSESLSLVMVLEACRR
jgi:hypothetical protein